MDQYVRFISNPAIWEEVVEVSNDKVMQVGAQELLSGEVSCAQRSVWAPWFKKVHQEDAKVPDQVR